MNPEDFNYFQSRVSRFISGSESRPLFGRVGSPKITRFSRFIPKRSVPSQVLAAPSTSEEDISASKGAVSSLGRLTLNLEVINNNLDRIKDIILNDYKETQETNRKELDDYRKRIANRGRVFGKRELGDKKSDILGTVRKYVGSFFSGTGGAIRALAAFNLLQGLMSGDPSKVIGPLLGIGLTYLPAIGAGIAGAVATSLVSRLFGGAGRAAAGAAQGAGTAAGAGRFAGLGRLGGRAALVGGGLSLASSIFNRPEGDSQQQRLEDLTQQQKGLVDSQSLVPVPQNDLKRFERLNKKFEEALDFLLGKQKGQPQQKSAGSGGGGGTPTPTGQPITGPAPAEINALMSAISGGEGGLESVNTIGTLPGLSQMTIDQAIAKVEQLRAQGKTSGAMGYMQQMSQYLRERSVAAGLNPAIDLFNAENQYKINRAYLASLFSGGEQEVVNLIRSGKIDQVVSKLRGVWPSLPGGSQENVHTSSFYQRYETFLKQLSSGFPSTPVLPPPIGSVPRARRPVGQAQQVPQVNVVPFAVPSEQSAPTSDAVEGNDSTPAINTTHPENFLALYSKLMYQIV